MTSEPLDVAEDVVIDDIGEEMDIEGEVFHAPRGCKWRKQEAYVLGKDFQAKWERKWGNHTIFNEFMEWMDAQFKKTVLTIERHP